MPDSETIRLTIICSSKNAQIKSGNHDRAKINTIMMKPYRNGKVTLQTLLLDQRLEEIRRMSICALEPQNMHEYVSSSVPQNL